MLRNPLHLHCNSTLIGGRRSQVLAFRTNGEASSCASSRFGHQVLTRMRSSRIEGDDLDAIDEMLNESAGNQKLQDDKLKEPGGIVNGLDLSLGEAAIGHSFAPSRIRGKYRLHILGSKHSFGPREYLLLPLNVGIRNKNIELDKLSQNVRKSLDQNKVASIFSNHGTLLGASCTPQYTLHKACGPLVQRALKELDSDGRFDGEQVQALAAVDGLCEWVAECIDRQGKGSVVLEKLFEGYNKIENGESTNETDRFRLQLESVEAIATGNPRPGHSVVGEGTYHDGEEAWTSLAKEFGHLGLAPEVELYRRHGATVAEAVHLADQSPSYLRKAGGAMLRMFFLR